MKPDEQHSDVSASILALKCLTLSLTNTVTTEQQSFSLLLQPWLLLAFYVQVSVFVADSNEDRRFDQPLAVKPAEQHAWLLVSAAMQRPVLSASNAIQLWPLL